MIYVLFVYLVIGGIIATACVLVSRNGNELAERHRGLDEQLADELRRAAERFTTKRAIWMCVRCVPLWPVVLFAGLTGPRD